MCETATVVDAAVIDRRYRGATVIERRYKLERGSWG
jgi:hypothetical protein